MKPKRESRMRFYARSIWKDFNKHRDDIVAFVLTIIVIGLLSRLSYVTYLIINPDVESYQELTNQAVLSVVAGFCLWLLISLGFIWACEIRKSVSAYRQKLDDRYADYLRNSD